MPQLAVGHKRTGACPTFDRPVLQRDGYLLRVPLVGGALSGPQAAAIAEIAGALGNGIVELTNRGNLQVRGLRSEVVEAALGSLRAVGLGDRSAALVTISPFARPAEHALRNAVVDALDELLAEGPVLSPKFVVHVDDAESTTTSRRAEATLAPTETDGRWALRIDRVGSLECTTADAVRAVTAVADACRHTADDARIAEILALHGRVWLRSQLGFEDDRWIDPPSSDEATADGLSVPANEPSVGHYRSGDGTSFVLAGARFGRTDAAALAHLAAFQRDQLDLRVTPWRSFAIAADPASQTATIDGLAQLGLIVDPTDPAAGVVSCIGTFGCWQTEVDTLAEAERFVAERSSSPADGIVHVSGCDKRCATRARVALTLLGRADGSGFDEVTA